MKLSQIDFDALYEIDEDLREAPKDLNLVLSRIDEVAAAMNEDVETEDRVRHLGELGFLYRTIGELDAAEAFLGEVMELIEEDDLGPRFYVIYGIRLAHVWQWQMRFEESNPMFDSIIEVCEKVTECQDLLDFALQHMGKNLFDQGRFDEAALFFEQALLLRLKKCDKKLIESTKRALDVCRKRGAR